MATSRFSAVSGFSLATRNNAFLSSNIDKRKHTFSHPIQTRPAILVSPSSIRAVSEDATSNENEKKTKKTDELEPLSDLDARVLQSLLADETLDLKSEDNLKQMLEKGVKKKAPTAKKQDDNSQYSSTFFKTITDNELWNSFVAKGNEVVESAKIFVQNRIERDAQLLASIGLFAWERTLKDVGRALPSAGKSGAGMAKKMRDSLFLLTTNSSFVEYIPKGNFILPPSKYSAGVETSVFEKLNTPMDEIKSVTEAIRDILSGKSVSQDRGLRSVAPAGASNNAERQKMAFERRKETVLKREKEGIDAKVMRATSTLADSAWELKREMEVEGNEAGYRAKNAQKQLEGRLASAGLLGGQDKLFRGIGERLFGSSTSESVGDSSTLWIESSAESTDPEDSEILAELTKADLNNERRRLVESLRACLVAPGETWLKPGATIEMSESQDAATTAGDDNNSSLEESYDLPHYASPRKPKSEPQPMPNSINTKSEESWANLITRMVLIRNDIEVQCNDEAEIFSNEDQIFAELANLKNTVNMICSLAAVSAGYEASEALKMELLGSALEGDQGSLLSSLDDIISFRLAQQVAEETKREQLRAQKAAVQEMETMRATQMEKPQIDAVVVIDDMKTIQDPFVAEFIVKDFEEDNKTDEVTSFVDAFESVLVSEVLPSDTVQSRNTGNNKQLMADAEFEVIGFASVPEKDYHDDDVYDGVYADVEIVTDDDQEAMEDDDEILNSAAFDESAAVDVKEEPPLIVQFALRSVDITLFVVEKTVTVGLPGIFTAYKIGRERTDVVNRQGMGKEGWDDLENVSSASKRY